MVHDRNESLIVPQKNANITCPYGTWKKPHPLGLFPRFKRTLYYLYLNCANYWCEKLSYRLDDVCDLKGGGVPKKNLFLKGIPL